MVARIFRCIAALVACSLALPALAQYRIETVAGGAIAPTSIPATQASMGPANGCAVDSAGNVYFSSASQSSVFKIDTTGLLTRVAGAASNGSPAARERGGAGAPLNSPQGLAFDKAGNLYIAESGANRVRKLSADGTMTTVAGNGTAGYAGDGALASEAQLSHPTGIAIDSAGNLYIADRGNYRIRMVSAGGIITTVAGNGQTGPYGLGDGGQATNAEISFAEGVAVDSHGNLYIADRMNSRVRMVDANGVITTVAGDGTFAYGGDGGTATAAQLNQPSAVAVDSAGNIYIADSGNNRIRVVPTSGTISTFAGTGIQGYSGDGGQATGAQIAAWGVTVDLAGNLYLYGGDSRMRKVWADGVIGTMEGGGSLPGSSIALRTQLQYPEGLASDANGNVYFAEAGNHVVRKLSANGTLAVVAGNGMPGYSGDGGSATGAQLNSPAAVAIDASGNLYISDYGNNVVRKVGTDHTIGTIAGGGTSVCPANGAPTTAQLLDPAGLAIDSQGNLYVADSGHGCVLEMTPAGQVSTIAGGNAPASDVFLSDQTSANATTLYLPQGVAADSSGNVYIADTGNACIRKVKPDGTIAVVAGNGLFGYAGDGGAAASAQLSAPWSVAVDASGNLYIADTVNERVREVATDGTITTIAGNGMVGYSGDGCDAAHAELNTPWSVAVDSNGSIYVSDWGNNAVRMLTTEAAEVASFGRSPRECGAERLPLDNAPGLFMAAPTPSSLSLPGATDFVGAGDSALIRAGGIPAPEQIHGLPRFHPDFMTSPSGNPYTPGPDPDFSYLSLLQPNLLFVQDIQRYVDLGNSLGAMADTLQGQAGSSMLTLRAQVLQYAGQQAWVLMMQDAYAHQGDWQPAMTYQTALGHTVPIYDAFLPSATGEYFAPSDLATLKLYLDNLPPWLPEYEHNIVIGPVAEMTGAAGDTGGSAGDGQSSIEGTSLVYATLPHEIAGTFIGGEHSGPLGQEWDILWNQSTEPIWDTVDVYSYYPPRPMPANEPIPWGDIAEVEDFASIVSNWACDSAVPRLNPSQSSSMLEEAVYGASLGHTVLLQKTLIVAAVFTTASPLELHLYNYSNYQYFAPPIVATVSPVQVTPTSLTLRDFTFTIQNSALTSVTSPASQVTVSGNTVNIPALNWTFPTPVPIPGYAATAWGIPQ
jgi:sugar lactone lactonase YvrE